MGDAGHAPVRGNGPGNGLGIQGECSRVHVCRGMGLPWLVRPAELGAHELLTGWHPSPGARKKRSPEQMRFLNTQHMSDVWIEYVLSLQDRISSF